MINGVLVGDKALVAKLKTMPTVARTRIADTVQKLGFALQARVQEQKLTGQVLKVRTGRLKASIAQGNADTRSRFEDSGNTLTSYVGTNVFYGAIWEYTGTKATTIVPVKAKALKFVIGGETLFRKSAQIPGKPARPFLAPALEEMRPLIVDQLGKALKDAMTEALK